MTEQPPERTSPPEKELRFARGSANFPFAMIVEGKKTVARRKESKPRKKAKQKAEERVVRKVRIINSMGLHARPSALFVQTANRFPNCRITVSNGTERVNGKSILGMLALEAGFGCRLHVTVDGPDEREAMEAIRALVESGFDEEMGDPKE